MLSLREIEGKRLVSFLREGDFAHAGEQEAIDFVMSKFEKKRDQQILDVGCGLGGTAHYLQEQQWGEISAFDIEEESIKHAKNNYKNINFYVSDVACVNKIFLSSQFDIICMFNSFYAFSDQKKALESVRKIAKSGGKLAIFDYSFLRSNKITPNFIYHDLNIRNFVTVKAPFIPIKEEKIEELLLSSGWRITDFVNVSKKYELWYESLVSKLQLKKEMVVEVYGEKAFLRARKTYVEMLRAIKEGILGGAIVYADKI